MSRKAAVQAQAVLEDKYPDALGFGVWNCRKISGSSTWSEHAWGAGLDITTREWGYSTNPEAQAALDEVAFFLETEAHDLSVWGLLWRVASHHDHIHVDFEPRGYGTPPCADGVLRSIYSDGTIIDGDPGPVNGPYKEDDSEMRTLAEWVAILRPKDIERAAEQGIIRAEEVSYWQGLLETPDNPEWQDYRNAVEVRRV